MITTISLHIFFLSSFQRSSSVFYHQSTPSTRFQCQNVFKLFLTMFLHFFKKEIWNLQEFSLQNHKFGLIVENSIYLSQGIQILWDSRNFQYIPQLLCLAPSGVCTISKFSMFFLSLEVTFYVWHLFWHHFRFKLKENFLFWILILSWSLWICRERNFEVSARMLGIAGSS